MKHLISDTYLADIANAIRQKDGTQTTMTVSDMPTRISNIPSGGGTDYMAERCQGTMTNYVVPSTNTQIMEYSFYAQRNLTSVTIPSSIRSISNYAFAYSGITSLVLPSNMDNLGSNLCYYCTSLTTVTFPLTLTNPMSNNSFQECQRLKTLINYRPFGNQVPMNMFNNAALEGDITLGDQVSVSNRAFQIGSSMGILYLHLTQTDTSLLASKYSFANNAFDTVKCRLVVPYSADHSILAAYQSTFPTWSSIMIEETT